MSLLPLAMGALALGLASGFSHCIGMCGVFVVSYAGLPEKNAPRSRRMDRHALFHGGRLFALACLGLAGGLIGQIGHRWAVAQGIVSLLVGLTMLGLALGMAGIVPRFRLPEPDVLGAGGGAGRRLFRRALQSRSRWKPLAIGLFVGLLPCGLTYNALMATFTLSPLAGAGLMLLFGLGTVPGLLALGVFGNVLFGGLLMRPQFRHAMTQVAAAIMAILGLVFICRAWPNL